jgi:hypothetical protein
MVRVRVFFITINKDEMGDVKHHYCIGALLILRFPPQRGN